MPEKDILLRVENLKMYFPAEKTLGGKVTNWVKAVDDVSFEVERGKTFGLVGESGCGKTTTGKCILRINDPTEGHIYYKGMDLATASKAQIRKIRREIQLIFQDPYGSLNPRQSCGDILREAIVLGPGRHDAKKTRERVAELLSIVELLPEMAERYPHELSGGQRQRLGIARALACDPELIVCDEPVSALDVSIQAQVINLFQKIQKELGLTYVFIAHDLAVVRHIADKIGVMYLGHIVETMDAEEIFTSPRHPYTKALLSAVPITDYDVERSRQRILLEGEVPSPLHAPKGCPFHPRCIYATDICRQQTPTLVDTGCGHCVACHNLEAVRNDAK